MPRILDDSAKLQNLAINGAFDFFQRYEGNTYSISGNTTAASSYFSDMFYVNTSGANGKTYTVTRSTTVPTQAQSGFQSTYAQLFTNTTVAGFATNDVFEPIIYKMEGFDYAKIHAKTASYGFWFTCSVAGTYSIAFRNSTLSRSYVTTFSAVSGYQFVSVVVPMDTSAGGTWNFDNTIGLNIDIASYTGASFQTSTLNAWQAGNFVCASTATAWPATAGATVGITQFQIYEGSLVLSPTGFSRCGKDIQQELAMCQRYYEKTFLLGVAPGVNQGYSGSNYSIAATGPRAVSNWCYQVRKRAIPSVALYSPDSGGVNRWSTNGTTPVMEGVSVGDTQLYAYASIATSNSSSGYSIHMTVDAGL